MKREDLKLLLDCVTKRLVDMTLKDGTVVSKDQVSVLLSYGNSNFRPILRFAPRVGLYNFKGKKPYKYFGEFLCSGRECQRYSGFGGTLPCPFAINVDSITPETAIVKPMNLEQFEESLDMTIDNLAILSRHSENDCHEEKEDKLPNFFFLIKSQPFYQQCDVTKYGTRIIRDLHGRIMVCLNVKDHLINMDSQEDRDYSEFENQINPDDISVDDHWSFGSDCGVGGG